MVLDKEVIEQSFKAIDGVRAVHFREPLIVSVELQHDSTKEMRYAVYDVEWELMRKFPKYLFDWHVIEASNDDSCDY